MPEDELKEFAGIAIYDGPESLLRHSEEAPLARRRMHAQPPG